MNLTRRVDGRAVALDARPLFVWARAAGSVYQAELQRALTARLGVAWGPDRRGTRQSLILRAMRQSRPCVLREDPQLVTAEPVDLPALVSLHSQVDLATVIGADGVVGPIGVRLNSSRRARSVVPASWGARHTSARRFSFDVPGVLFLVVPESGRVTVFSGGGMAARITDGRRGDQSSPAVPEDDCRETQRCPVCERGILITMSEAARSVAVGCPVCNSPLAVPAGGRVVGVPIAVKS